MQRVFLVMLTVFAALAQDQPPTTAPAPPVLENQGKPMLAPFQCSEEDIRSAGLACSEEDPCQVYLELAATVSTGTRIFAAGNIHTERSEEHTSELQSRFDLVCR